MEHGRFVNLQKADGDLQILLNTNGERVFRVIEGIRERLGTDTALRVILGDHLKSRWQEIKPEEIGAPTSALIVSDEAERDSRARLMKLGRVYWNPSYQVQDEIAELREKGLIIFQGVE
jgi:hypothetical protein